MHSFLLMMTLMLLAVFLVISPVWGMTMSTKDGVSVVHYGFKTDNGHTRTEDIKFNQTQPKQIQNENESSVADKKDDDSENIADEVKKSSSSKSATGPVRSKKWQDDVKPVEYRGGYSFISADGYEYTVLYKANKNGFHPYVTAKKITMDDNDKNAKRDTQ